MAQAIRITTECRCGLGAEKERGYAFAFFDGVDLVAVLPRGVVPVEEHGIIWVRHYSQDTTSNYAWIGNHP